MIKKIVSFTGEEPKTLDECKSIEKILDVFLAQIEVINQMMQVTVIIPSGTSIKEAWKKE